MHGQKKNIKIYNLYLLWRILRKAKLQRADKTKNFLKLQKAVKIIDQYLHLKKSHCIQINKIMISQYRMKQFVINVQMN